MAIKWLKDTICAVLLGSMTYFSTVVHAQFDITTDPNRCCSRIPNTTYADTSCRATRLSANEFQQAIGTPNFPGAFEPGIFCKWEIFARPGRRIHVDIRNMFLVHKKENDCEIQQLIVTSPLTGLSLGPFCGHDGLPIIITAGNYVIVELLSPYPTEGKKYKGFQIVYMETVQATSIGLRPPDWTDSMYLEYNTGPPTRRPRLRPNRNRKTTTKPRRNPTTTTERPKRPRDQNRDQKKKPPIIKSRVLSNPNNLRNIYVPNSYNPNFRNRRSRINSNGERKNEGIGTEAVVGIAVGGILLVTIIALLVAKIGYRSKKNKGKRDDEHDISSKSVQQSNSSSFYWDKMNHVTPAQQKQRNIVEERRHRLGLPGDVTNHTSHRTPSRKSNTELSYSRPIKKNRSREQNQSGVTKSRKSDHGNGRSRKKKKMPTREYEMSSSRQTAKKIKEEHRIR